MGEDATESKKQKPAAEVLRSRDAKDIVWWFRFGGSAVGGLQACDVRRGAAQTLRSLPKRDDPTTKFCCACAMACDAKEAACPYCRGRRFKWPRASSGDFMAVRGSRGGRSTAATEKRDGQLMAAPRERRIRDGLARMTAVSRRVLQLWAESKQHGPEIRSALGQAADLAMGLSRCQAAFRRYVEGGGEHSLEVWLVGLCREAQKHKGLLGKIREQGEELTASAVRDYQAVRERPSKHELDGTERPVRRSPTSQAPLAKTKIRRPGVLERCREEVRRRAKRTDRGVPFLPGGE